MSVVEIRKAGDKVLKEEAKSIVTIDREIKRIIDDMAETMYASDGVGLAAPQIGVSLRIIVVDVGEGLIELINPVILEAQGKEIATEGCLSVPGIYGEVERAEVVIVEGLNRFGKKATITGTGLLSRAFQHEIDHLNGILFIDKAQSITTVR